MKVTSGLALLASAGFANAATMGSRAEASSRAVAPRGAQTSGEHCAKKSFNEGGNWYCEAVSQVLYTNVGLASGSYQEVVFMDPVTGRCDKKDRSIGGGIAPFDEPLSIHFRGPVQLKKLAVYTHGSTTKRDAAVEPAKEVAERVRAKRHGHKHARFQHKHSHLHSEREAPKVIEKKDVWVTAVIDGKTVSWINNWFGPETSAPPAAAATAPAAAPTPDATTPEAKTTAAAPVSDPAPTKAAGIQAEAYAPQATAPATAAPKPSATTPTTGGDYGREAFYDAESGTAEGLVFLGNYGGTAGSGNWSEKFGNTLSYLDASGLGGAASPQVLSNTVIPSVKEFSIFSDRPCTTATCNYWQPGAVAYEGFGYGDKTIVAEILMPHEGGDLSSFLKDQSAYWFLNAQIPRTQQYGGCSAWPNAGEFDVIETLSNGDDKAKSTLHLGDQGSGGDSSYFERPATKSMIVATVFDVAGRQISVKVLDDSFGFPSSLSSADIQEFLNPDGGAGTSGSTGASLFAIAS